MWNVAAGRSLYKRLVMADIKTPEKNGRSRLQPRVDMTPMVDLGFILITFFIYTTTLIEDKSLVVNKPFITEPSTVFIDTSTITVMPTGANRYAYYSGMLDGAHDIVLLSSKDLREVLMARQKDLLRLPEHYSEQARKLHVIIKPEDHCTYENVVYVLDEMLIHKVPYYTLVDITPQEADWVAALL